MTFRTRLIAGLIGAILGVVVLELFAREITAGWIAWIVVVLGTFGFLEWQGLRRKAVRGTLSYLFWRILFVDHELILEGKHPRQPRLLVYFLVLAPFVWLLVHFFLGGRLG